MCQVTQSQIKSCPTRRGEELCPLLGYMTQCIEDPAVKISIFKFSGLELETGRQEKILYVCLTAYGTGLYPFFSF